jgi:hypothetical protein
VISSRPERSKQGGAYRGFFSFFLPFLSFFISWLAFDLKIVLQNQIEIEIQYLLLLPAGTHCVVVVVCTAVNKIPHNINKIKHKTYEEVRLSL